jgi:lipopolysaccharide/colanic/teichoic acid biosynthesis glycosyltransferase
MIWWRGFLNRFLIRICDILFSLTGLIIFSPVIILTALIIFIDSPGKFFFRQVRVGKNNTDFLLYKFRTMRANSDKLKITVGSRDPRITKPGVFIRKYKLDELPQLFNVLLGQMSLVGPRPEVRHYTEMYTLGQQMRIFSVKPGVTDIASIEYSKENEILSSVNDPENYYINVLMPDKMRLNMVFIESPTLRNYLHIILKTIIKIFRH